MKLVTDDKSFAILRSTDDSGLEMYLFNEGLWILEDEEGCWTEDRELAEKWLKRLRA